MEKKELIKKIKTLKKYGFSDEEIEILEDVLSPKLELRFERVEDDIYFKHLQENKFVFLQKHSKVESCFNSQAKTFGSIIECDNLLGLYLLQNIYKDKIDLIYIDPPYNTGKNTLTYSNDYRIKKEDFKNKIVKYNDKDGLYHSRWLSLIERRLKLAKKLLKDDGIIAVSIDDNELYHLKLLMNQIFGSDCYRGTLIWYKGIGMSTQNSIRKSHEYILLYEKINGQNKFFNQSNKKNKIEEENLQIRPLICIGSRGDRFKTPSLWYPITCPTHQKEIWPINRNNEEKRWVISKKTLKNELFKKNIICKQKNGKCILNRMIKEKGNLNLISILNYIRGEDSYTEKTEHKKNKKWIKTISNYGSTDLKEDLKNASFDYPKPVNLLKNLFGYLCPKNGKILDFYAGSGTTGCATAKLNQEDGGKRQFVLISNNDGDVFKKNVCIFRDILYQRLKQSQKKYQLSFKTFEIEEKELKNLKSDDNYLSHLKKSLETCKNLINIKYPKLKNWKENEFIFEIKKENKKYGFEENKNTTNLLDIFKLKGI